MNKALKVVVYVGNEVLHANQFFTGLGILNHQKLINVELRRSVNQEFGKSYIEVLIEDKKVIFELYDITGKRLQLISLPANQSSMVFDFSMYAAGMYQYRVIVDNKVGATGKVMTEKTVVMAKRIIPPRRTWGNALINNIPPNKSH